MLFTTGASGQASDAATGVALPVFAGHFICWHAICEPMCDDPALRSFYWKELNMPKIELYSHDDIGISRRASLPGLKSRWRTNCVINSRSDTSRDPRHAHPCRFVRTRSIDSIADSSEQSTKVVAFDKRREVYRRDSLHATPTPVTRHRHTLR